MELFIFFHEWYDPKIILYIGFVYTYSFIYAIKKRKNVLNIDNLNDELIYFRGSLFSSRALNKFACSVFNSVFLIITIANGISLVGCRRACESRAIRENHLFSPSSVEEREREWERWN